MNEEEKLKYLLKLLEGIDEKMKSVATKQDFHRLEEVVIKKLGKVFHYGR